MTREKTYTAQQPLFFPKLYMIERFRGCGYLVHMGSAQFVKGSHHNRVEVADAKGKPVFIRLPTGHVPLGTPIDKVVLKYGEGVDTLFGTLDTLYSRTTFYKVYREDLQELLRSALPYHGLLGALNRVVLKWLFRQFLFSGPKTWDDHQLLAERPKSPSRWVAGLGRALNAEGCGVDTFLGGADAQAAYIVPSDFAPDLKLRTQDFKCRPYRELGGTDPGSLSVLDALFYGGPDLVEELTRPKEQT